MQRGPRYDPLTKNEFFPNQMASRPLVEGTVARGQLREDTAFYTGKVNGEPVDSIPIPLTRDLLVRGQERFTVYCTPCHGGTGVGNGVVVQRGFKPPPSFHEQRLRDMQIGYFVDVITNGFGNMQDYAAQVKPQDRWAIAAYIRALQLSQNATIDDVPVEDRPKLDEAPRGDGGGGTP